MSDYIEAPVMIANLSKNCNCPISNRQRENVIGNFFRNVSPKPYLILSQEAYVRSDATLDQIDTVLKALPSDWESCSNEEFGTEFFQKYNVIMNDSSKVVFETNNFSFDVDTRRFAISKYSIQDELLLVVSFHGYHRMNMVKKTENLKKYLQGFLEMKRQSGCNHLIIGGDFNIDLDNFETEEWQFLEELNLKIVPYQNQRDGSKIDGLICDKAIANLGVAVTVYSDKDAATDDEENTTVSLSGLPRFTMDHHLILFNLKLPLR
jgi:hypothetical protein